MIKIRQDDSQYSEVHVPPDVSIRLLKQQSLQITHDGNRKKLATEFKKLAAELEKNKNPQLSKEANSCYKWLQHTTFPPALIATDYSSVEYIVETGLLHAIMLYQASADMLEGDPHTIKEIEGKAYIQKNGNWEPVEQVQQGIQPVYIDGKFEKFEGWTYTHPNGFIQQDRFNWTDIKKFPIAKLRPDALKAIQKKAQASDKDYILQPIITDECQTKNFSIFKNFARFNGIHAHAMIIDPEGHVYSCGTMLEGDEMRRLQSGYGAFTAATANAKLNGPDYDLARINCVHHTAYLKMSQEQAEKAFNYINQVNQGSGMRFNMLRQNCARFVQGLLHEAEYEVNSALSAKELIRNMLPNIEHIPVVGGPLKALSDKVQSVTEPLLKQLNVVSDKTPLWMKHAYAKLREIVWFVPDKLSVFVISTAAVIFLGGGRGVSVGPQMKESPSNETKLRSFTRLFNSFKDLFDESRTTAYLPFKIAEWMKDEKTDAYVVFDNRKKALLPLKAENRPENVDSLGLSSS